MIRGVEVLGSVFVFGGVATADMTADQTFTQMYSAIAHFQTFLAACGAGCNVFDLLDMRTVFTHIILLMSAFLYRRALSKVVTVAPSP